MKYTDPQKRTYQRMFAETKRKYHRALAIQFLSILLVGLSVAGMAFVGCNVFCIGVTVIFGAVAVGAGMYAFWIWRCPACGMFFWRMAPKWCPHCGLELG